MLRLDQQFPSHDQYDIKADLDQLLMRLKPGMKLNGRIVECLGENKYLLRIWGYNILTESEKLFRQFNEIQLVVQAVKPNLVFELFQDNRTIHTNNRTLRTDILVQ